jgi:hypothetical protein
MFEQLLSNKNKMLQCQTVIQDPNFRSKQGLEAVAPAALAVQSAVALH